MRPYRVRPNPFWKSVRPVVPERVILKPDVVTARTYTICFTGVVVPYVCTSGSAVCGHWREPPTTLPTTGPLCATSEHAPRILFP
jgi:hypothetical protein